MVGGRPETELNMPSQAWVKHGSHTGAYMGTFGTLEHVPGDNPATPGDGPLQSLRTHRLASRGRRSPVVQHISHV